MPAGLMVPTSHVPSLMARQANKTPYTPSGLSLAQPNMNMAEGQFDASATADNDQGTRMREDEFESKSGSDNVEGGSTGEDQEGDRRPRKKRYHRHTQHQIQEMEMFFKECPHPDDKQRKELSRELGLEPLQVKFWFQNKRTQMKTQHERHENTQLRGENEKLRADNMRYREALNNASCPNCGGPAALGEISFDDQQLRIENARLRDEIDRISGIAAKYVGKPLLSIAPAPLNSIPRSNLDLAVGNYGMQPSIGTDIYVSSSLGELSTSNGKSIVGPTEVEKPMVVELAVAAMEELVRMAQMGEPLWTSDPDDALVGNEILNDDEYSRTFIRGIGPRLLGMKAEASRENALILMNAINLVETLMDVNQWASMFPGIISRAFTVDVFSTGVAGNYNGALQVMYAEFQLPSPLVPTRENYFVRYCKQHSDGIWAVADVSLDGLRGSPSSSMMRSRRRPSGCIIQEMPNGYSKVTWVEHAEIDERSVHHIYRQLLNSGLAFGAKRWVANLQRQCERLASVMATNIPKDLGVIPNPEGRKSMLKLAERMAISFCSGVCASSAHTWTSLSGNNTGNGGEDVRVMIRKSVDDPGRPPGIVLSAATSFWLPVAPKRVFDFLRDENSRNEWDILSNGGLVQEMAHIGNGQDPGNCVSLLRVNSVNTNQSNMLILQESCTDDSGSFVIYAPVDIVAMNAVLSGGDPDYVAILPSGFAILPDGPKSCNSTLSNGSIGVGIINDLVSPAVSRGSLLTVAFQILVDSVPTAKLSLGSVATVNSLISCTVDRIKAAVTCENP